MGRYAKHLIPRELLAAVNTANTALREHHNLNTLAWGDDGTRILPAANYLAYQARQQSLEHATKSRTARPNQPSVSLAGVSSGKNCVSSTPSTS